MAFGDRQSLDKDDLVARFLASGQGQVVTGYPQDTGQEVKGLPVSAVIYGRGGYGYLQGAILNAQDSVSTGAGLQSDG